MRSLASLRIPQSQQSCIAEWGLLFSRRFLSFTRPVTQELDLYQDVSPFDAGTPQESISFPQLREVTPSSASALHLPPLLLPPSVQEHQFNHSDITRSFFLLHKKHGQLLDFLAIWLSKTIPAKHFYIASSGRLDVLESGLALMCCGQAVDFIDYFDSLPHRYKGILKLGQVSDAGDLKTPVQSYYPWKHLQDDALQEAARCFQGDLLLPPAPLFATRHKKEGNYFTFKRTTDMTARPSTIHSFHVHRTSPTSPEVHFDLSCDSVLAPVALTRAFGEHLGCGALLYELEKTSIGEYTSEVAWDPDQIYEAFSTAERGKIHFPNDLREAHLKSRAQRHLERIVGRNWYHIYDPPKKVKLKPFEKRMRKQQRLADEAAGLISDEDIMKRKLKKKAVKLVANLNVDAVEDVFTQIMEE